MEVLFVTDFSPIVTDPAASRNFYVGALGLPLAGDPPWSEKIEGVKHIGLWPLKDAARVCFGTDEWPSHLPIPQANIEFEVRDVAAAAAPSAIGTLGANNGPSDQPRKSDRRHMLHALVSPQKRCLDHANRLAKRPSPFLITSHPLTCVCSKMVDTLSQKALK